MYGLSDAGRQFYLKLKKLLKENGYISTLGDECFFRRYDKNSNLEGFLVIHVDDLAMDGSKAFVDSTIQLLKNNLTISKVVKKQFRFCGLDSCQKDGKTVLSMEDYAKSMMKNPLKDRWYFSEIKIQTKSIQSCGVVKSFARRAEVAKMMNY